MIDILKALHDSIPPELQLAMDEAVQAGALSGLYLLLVHGDTEAFDRALTERINRGL